MPDIVTWLIIASSLFIGCWVQTAMGFGMAVFAAPIIIMLKPELVPSLITLLAWLLSILNSRHLWKDIEWSKLKLPFVTRIPGTMLGAWLLLQLNVVTLQIFIALCVLAAVLISALGKQFNYTPTRWGLAAFASGITGTTTSIGGPPMALVMQHGNPHHTRANLSVYFVYSCTVSLISYAWIGIFDVKTIWVGLMLCPMCILGFRVGKRTQKRINTQRYRPLLLTLCAVSGSIALIGALLN